ncbi:MAG: holo-ACP synthase [Chlamydiia bacterium]|nr:holo-ACP synthase [Chlamydiia bacterium]MCP5508872.1 holo-ACP synthase [Chlamydiales bacterium]
MIGTDIIEIERIRQSIEKHGQHFLDRLFTAKEQADCKSHKNPEIRFAGRFAAKEAIAKALGTGIGKELSWLDIEIINDAAGRPQATLTNKKTVHISISHCKSYATAVAMLIPI